jgi:hypothetical protein
MLTLASSGWVLSSVERAEARRVIRERAVEIHEAKMTSD